MIILGIETSCDDTSVALITENEILANCISTQVIHKEFGGVVPELASREHLKLIQHIVDSALKEANIKLSQIDYYSATYGPGLVGALLVGLNYAKGISVATGKPYIGINHMEGHIASNYLENPDWEPPFITLLCSGGHTQLVHVRDWTDFKILGSTRDDAIGEAFDKTAKLLGLPYPGGPHIDQLSKKGNPNAVDFPTPFIQNTHLDFSYSGLKTAVLTYINRNPNYNKADVAASFQRAAIDALIVKLKRASAQLNLNRVAIAGGVSANSHLRKSLEEMKAEGYEINMPRLSLCTDNAAMIAKAAEIRIRRGERSDLNLNAKAVLSLESVHE
ncbi:MAG: tRNA (adenosine(37)-N6)-threonylcarbamoyltransferase complex transferase subunit TsaD [Calditrichaeota bacterium]|nr:tRNA (adenosine(37)-N6)-threonylcarbamoyltransferase complex transferase subunit TsaD [Calditrichota bacterium]